MEFAQCHVELSMVLGYCNLKNIKSQFPHENTKLFLENIFLTCCNSSSFDILWTHIDIYIYQYGSTVDISKDAELQHFSGQN